MQIYEEKIDLKPKNSISFGNAVFVYILDAAEPDATRDDAAIDPRQRTSPRWDDMAAAAQRQAVGLSYRGRRNMQ